MAEIEIDNDEKQLLKVAIKKMAKDCPQHKEKLVQIFRKVSELH